LGCPTKTIGIRADFFSWLGFFRRLSKNFEILPATAENKILIGMLKLTLENDANVLPDSFKLSHFHSPSYPHPCGVVII
jgi:hypothetical protein